MSFLDKIPVIGSAIKNFIDPVAKLVDDVHTSDEERGQLRLAIATLTEQLAEYIIAREAQVMESLHKVWIATQQHGNWFSKSARPAAVLILTSMIFIVYGIPALRGAPATVELPPKFWDAYAWVLGIFVAGRSLQYVAKHLDSRTGKAVTDVGSLMSGK